MLDQELLRLVKSFLGKRSEAPTWEECRAWEEFYLRYDVVARDTIGRNNGGLDIVDDVVQEVWIMLIRKLPRWVFDPALGTIGSWVAKIAKRVATKRARRNSRRRAEALNETVAATLVDLELGPDAEFERMQEHELFGILVGEFAASMDLRDGRIVILRFVESWPMPEIAHHLKLSDATVRSVLHRATPKLRDFLSRRGLRPL